MTFIWTILTVNKWLPTGSFCNNAENIHEKKLKFPNYKAECLFSETCLFNSVPSIIIREGV